MSSNSTDIVKISKAHLHKTRQPRCTSDVVVTLPTMLSVSDHVVDLHLYSLCQAAFCMMSNFSPRLG